MRAWPFATRPVSANGNPRLSSVQADRGDGHSKRSPGAMTRQRTNAITSCETWTTTASRSRSAIVAPRATISTAPMQRAATPTVSIVNMARSRRGDEPVDCRQTAIHNAGGGQDQRKVNRLSRHRLEPHPGTAPVEKQANGEEQHEPRGQRARQQSSHMAARGLACQQHAEAKIKSSDERGRPRHAERPAAEVVAAKSARDDQRGGEPNRAAQEIRTGKRRGHVRDARQRPLGSIQHGSRYGAHVTPGSEIGQRAMARASRESARRSTSST